MKPKSTLRSFLLACGSLLAVSALHADTLTWDPAGGGTSDGAGTWLTAGKWWNGANVDWNNGTPDNAIIGNGGTGGTITLGAVTAGTVLFQDFSGAYVLNGGSLAQSGGITVSSTAGNVQINSPISGNGGITVDTGYLNTQNVTPANLTYTGPTILNNGGELQFRNTTDISAPGSNIQINDGIYSKYYDGTMKEALGTGAGELQILGGESGFSGNRNIDITLGSGTAQVQWGSTYFNPSTLVLQSSRAPTSSTIEFKNGLDLDGAQRSIASNSASGGGGGYGAIDGQIVNTDGVNPAGLTKVGAGAIRLTNNGNSYNGPTIVNEGVLQLGSAHTSAQSIPGRITTPFSGTGSNLEINGGNVRLAYYLQRSLGSGPYEFQITGGTSGFSHTQPDTYGRLSINNDVNYEVVWGSTFFQPAVFVLNDDNATPDQVVNFQNKLDLNGADRTVATNSTLLVSSTRVDNNNGNMYTTGGRITGNIRNSQGSPAGLIKTGPGHLQLTGTNIYDGGTTINEGRLQFTTLTSMPATGVVTVNDGATLGVEVGGSGWSTGTSGNGTIGGLLAGLGGQSGSTVSYVDDVKLSLNSDGSNTYSGVIPDVGTSLGLVLTGGGLLALDQANTYSGGTSIFAGMLVAGTGNIGSGKVTFDSPTNSVPAIWGGSGLLEPTIGTNLLWNAAGGFAATDSPLTVTLNGGAALSFASASPSGMGGNMLQLNSPHSTAPVTVTNNINVSWDWSFIRMFDNPATSADVGILSGVITNSANRTTGIFGSGTLVLSNSSNNFGTGTLQLNEGVVVRAVDGVGLNTTAKLNLNNGIFESQGTFTRNIGTGNGEVTWSNSGGFAANGGPLSVSLEGGVDLTWGSGSVGFSSKTLYLGSRTADDVVTLANNIILDGNRTIQTIDNPYSEDDHGVIAGNISQSGTRTLTVQGDGKVVFAGANSYTGTTTINGGTLIINGDCTAATGLVDVKANGKFLGGTGTIGGNVTLENNAGLTFDLITAPGSHDELNVGAAASGKTLTFESASVLNITSSGGTPSTGTYTLVSTDGGITGSVPATVNLPVDWTADAPQIVGNDLVINITSTGSASPYDTWAATYSPADLSNKAGDNDLDSLTNLQEFAFGTNPTSLTSGSITYVANGEVTTPGLPVAVNLASPGVDYRAIFGRRKDYIAAGLIYTVQFSAGLDYWVNSTDTPTELTSSTGDIDAVSVPYPFFITTPNGSEKPTFFRVALSETTP